MLVGYKYKKFTFSQAVEKKVMSVTIRHMKNDISIRAILVGSAE